MLDQPRAEDARLVGIAGVVIDDQGNWTAVYAALVVDIGELDFQCLLFGGAQECGWPGDRKHGADLDIGMRAPGSGQKGGKGNNSRQALPPAYLHGAPVVRWFITPP